MNLKIFFSIDRNLGKKNPTKTNKKLKSKKQVKISMFSVQVYWLYQSHLAPELLTSHSQNCSFPNYLAELHTAS